MGAAVGAHLPPASTLVELSLTPFKTWKRDAAGDHDGKGGEAVRGTPPVVKIIVTLLGFESLTKTAAVSVRGQRTLDEMMRQQKGAGLVGRTDHKEGIADSNPVDATPPGSAVTEATAPTAKVLHPTGRGSGTSEDEVLRYSELRSRDESDCVHILPQGGDEEGAPRVSQDSVLVRCPKCKACLPIGRGWDEHRERHSALDHSRRVRREPSRRTTTAVPGQPSCITTSRAPSVREPGPDIAPPPGGVPPGTSTETYIGPPPREAGQAGERKVPGNTRQAVTAEDAVVQDEKRALRLSALLPLAVGATEAMNILRTRGLLRADGVTRFANLYLDESEEWLKE